MSVILMFYKKKDSYALKLKLVYCQVLINYNTVYIYKFL